jgi:hypothetical protein
MDVTSEYMKVLVPLPSVACSFVYQGVLHLSLVARPRDLAAQRSEKQDHFASSVRNELDLLERIRQRTTLPWGLLPFDVSNVSSDQHRVSTPDSAAPSGFLNLLTLSSAHAASALFHADSVLGVSAFRGFSLPVAATVFTARCPSCRSSHDATSGIDAFGRFVHERPVLPGYPRPILSER